MANPFTSPTLSGFNSSPPADDGSQIAANQLKWSNHVTKLATPLKTYIDDLVTNTNTAFATVDDASNLTTGKLPDARLSANVPRKDAVNTFTKTGASLAEAAVSVSAGLPGIVLDETDAAANEGRFGIRVNSGELQIFNIDDTDTLANLIIRALVTGSNVDELRLIADAITANGSEVLTPAEVAAATAIEGNALASTDGFYVDDASVPKRMAYQDAGLRVVTKSASATLVDGEMNAYIIANNASAMNITLNTGIGVQGNVLLIKQAGAGQVTVNGTATLESSVGTKTRAQNSVIALVNEGSDVWSVSGDAST